MTRRISAFLLATALSGAVACFHDRSPIQSPASRRLKLLEQAFAAKNHEPDKAARLFEEAGPGSSLEQVRLDAWFASLERANAPLEQWRAFLSARLPHDLRIKARAIVGLLLADAGQTGAAIAVLEAPTTSSKTDLALLTAGDPAARDRAARRLAVADPHLLRRASRALEQSVVKALDPAERIERARRWRELGVPSRAAAELDRQRFKGDDERQRRLELGRAWVGAGQPRRALGLLPKRPAPEENLLKAEAHLRQAWQRYPKASSRSSFSSCLAAAQRVANSAPSTSLQRSADLLILECATESGALDQALVAWYRLESDDLGERGSWLGRRLGVALARAGRPDAAIDIGLRLPTQERCLRYWAASSSASAVDLEFMAAAPVTDLYGSWARAELSAPPAAEIPAAKPDLSPARAPPTVRWLIDQGAESEASREWRRIRSARGTVPGEALAAALFERDLGRANASIRVLRSAFPDLGSTEILSLPPNVVREYLPLKWHHELMTAAAESGADPWLIAALARQESLFVAHARSPRGALGVLQLIPTTAQAHARALGLVGKPDLLNPADNLRLGARELAGLLREFGSVEPALAAYNAGPARSKRWWSRWPDRRVFTENVPIPETYTYIRRVVFLADAYRQVYEPMWRTP